MEATTISFDFDDANPPASQPLPESSQIPVMKQHLSHMSQISQPPVDFPSDDSTSSASLAIIRGVDPFCEPFMMTPEPSLSPPVFDSISIPPSLASSAPLYCPCGCGIILEATRKNCSESSILVSTTTNPHELNYERDQFVQSSPLSLLPLLLPSQPVLMDNVECGVEMLEPRYLPSWSEPNLHFCLPAFEMAFRTNRTYEHFVTHPHQPQSELEIMSELSPYDHHDSAVVYEPL